MAMGSRTSRASAKRIRESSGHAGGPGAVALRRGGPFLICGMAGWPAGKGEAVERRGWRLVIDGPDPLDRMFRVLVRTIRTKYPAFLTDSFTLSELQQQILPYRHYRRDLGLESNVEYELMVMQLLTGAKGYLEVDE